MGHPTAALTPLSACATAPAFKDHEESRKPAPNSNPYTGNTPNLQQIENMLKEDIILKERLAQMHNIPPAVLEALCGSVGGASASSLGGHPVAVGPVAEARKFKEEEAPSEKRRRLTVETLDALLAAKRRTNSENKAEEKESTVDAQSGRAASSHFHATSTTTVSSAAESEAPSSSSRGDSEMSMPTPNRRGYGVEGDDSNRQRFIPPQA